MKSWARELALGLVLTTAIPSAAAVAAAQSAEEILIKKANYWRLKDRPDLAIEALKQLLSINPNQPDALYQYGVIEVQRGRLDAAKGYLERLRKAAPNSPRVADLENAIRVGQVSPNELSEARRLAQSGQFAEAAKKYQQSFRGAPPPTFGVEYYMTLAGTSQGWDEARRGLEALVQKSPNDSKAKVALAEVLTYHADTRARGIRMLEQLASDPVVGTQAARAWKQAMMWLGGGAEDRRLYTEYLAKFPQDADVRQHMAEAEKQGAAGPGATTSAGYGDLNRGNLAAAERRFAADLRRDPNDPSALAGLGIVRLRQHRLSEAREMLRRAIGEYRRVLASNPHDQAAHAGLRGALAAERSAETAGVRSGTAGQAAAPVNSSRARADRLRSEGTTMAERGDLAGAQAKYQEAIAVDPNDAWARLDYARFLVRHGSAPQAMQIIDPAASGGTGESLYAAAIFDSEQNRFPEALALLERIPAGSRTPAMTAFRDRILVTADIDRAKQLARSGNRGAARNVLMSLYAQPPKTPEKTRLVADALADIGYTGEALQLARPSGAAARGDARAALDYAGLLVRAGRDAEAVAYLTQAERNGTIAGDTRRQLERLKTEIASQRAEELRRRGDLAGAYDQISSLLAAYPNDPTLLLAAGRIYAAAGKNDIAMRFIDAAFREAPGDVNVIRGAVGGAIVAGDLTRASAYLGAGMRLYPNNARLYYLAAQIARSNGNTGAAVYDLQVARRLDTRQAGGFEPLPTSAPISVPGAPMSLPPNPFRQSQALSPHPVMMLAAAASPIVATDGSSTPPAASDSAAPSLEDTAVSADSDDLTVPPHAGERPPRPLVNPFRSTAASTGGTPPAPLPPQLALLPTALDPDIVGAGESMPSEPAPAPAPRRRRVAELEPLPPPPIQTYDPAAYAPPPGPVAAALPLQPLPPPPVAGYQPRYFGQAAPAPQDSLELDIERSMAAISAEAGPLVQGGLSFRFRDGESGLSRLVDVGVPIEGSFSPGYTGRLFFGATPEFLTAGTPGSAGALSNTLIGQFAVASSGSAVTRFGSNPLTVAMGHAAQLALNQPISDLVTPVGAQNASGVAFSGGYAFRNFTAQIGTTPLGFPVTNVTGRLMFAWPGEAGTYPDVTYADQYSPTVPRPIALAPRGTPANPFQVRVEGQRQPITDSLLSYAGTKDPGTGITWGGVVKTGGDVLASYDDGTIGFYGTAGGGVLDGKHVAKNTEIEGSIGGFVRPYRAGNDAFKVGVNLTYLSFDKNLNFYSIGQGGYFSPQNYVNFSVPLEYSGRTGRFTYLVGGALGIQTFDEKSSPVFPIDSGPQALLAAASPSSAFYPSRSITGISFGAHGQVEYQLDNGFSVGGLASIDNAQDFTEGIAKVYLRKSFGVAPPATTLPYSLPGSL